MPNVLPIVHVIQHLPAALVLIAPEREQELARLWSEFSLSALPTHERIIRYVIDQKKIEISAGAMTVLWVFSHAYVTLYDKVIEPWVAGAGEINLHDDPELSAAMRLLDWGLHTWGQESNRCWPAGLRSPMIDPPPQSPENVADELALTGAAFALHHELAHHRQEHWSADQSIEEEQDADREAAAWILAKVDPKSREFQKRVLGIAAYLISFVAFGIRRKHFGGESHPRHYNRLIQVLEPYAPPKHRVWQFIALAVKLHLDDAGIETETPEGGHAHGKAAVEAYALRLGELERKWEEEERRRELERR